MFQNGSVGPALVVVVLAMMMQMTQGQTDCRQDIGFIIDGSSSITNKDFQKVKNWLSETIQGFFNLV